MSITEFLRFKGVALNVRSPPCLAENDCFKSVPGVSCGSIADFLSNDDVNTVDVLHSVFYREIVAPLYILLDTTGIFFMKSGWGRLLKEYLRNSSVFFCSICCFI